MSLHDAAPALTVKRKRVFSPEHRAKLSDAQRRRWADPVYHEKQMGKILAFKRSPEGRARHRAKLLRFHNDPHGGLKLRAQALRRKIAKMQKQLAEWDKLLGNDCALVGGVTDE